MTPGPQRRPTDGEEFVLDRSCRYLKGVGPRRAVDLARLGIETVEDLLLHFPRDYLRPGERRPLAGLKPGERVPVRGQILAVDERRPRGGLRLLSVLVDDGTGRLTLVFFNQPYLKQSLKVGTEVLAYGEVTLFGSTLQMQSPEVERLGEDDRLLERPFLPIYPLTRGIGQRWLRRLVDRVLADPALPAAIAEILPGEWRRERGWPDRAAALRSIHFPETGAELAGARERLKFDELFLLQLLGALRRARRRRGGGPDLSAGAPLVERFLAALPYVLTGAQRRALQRIRADVAGGEAMQRLLQGDVGSGKTVVALAALVQAAGAGRQGAFMVPLEVLARQHFLNWEGPLAELGLSAALLTGSTPARERRATLAALAAGELDLVFGTQALIQDDVAFADLGLAVVDEQHRFGVRQRGKLRGQRAPHVLVMTATPIPRSLAMTLYGDLDLTVIDELPPGRPPLVTRLTTEAKLPAVYGFVRERLEAGERAFLVFPLVEESDRAELKAATEAYAALSEREFAGIPSALLHGRMKPAEKAAVLESLRAGSTRLLVATTVIEVGLDVPEATLMVIHNPERFGLSQLHQLRGRVGRGTAKSWCVLAQPPGLGEEARRRLETFAAHADGFRLAEEDLKARGPGDVFGLRQHGRPELSLAHPLHDAELVALARARATDLARRDPELTAVDLAPLRALLERAYGDRLALGAIG